ncbi:MAG: hypothetical protein ACRDTH_04320 [Pseudonocardiaceae bacterium]
MASWTTQRWVLFFDAPSRAGQRGGAYRAYLPDELVTRPVVLSAKLAARAAEVESRVRALSIAPETRALEGLARFLLRSEAIASSRIEGMQVAPQQLALAELAQSEQLVAASFTRNAQLVANNITTLRRAASDLATAPSITAAGIDDLHHALLPDEQHRGQRTVLNWPSTRWSTSPPRSPRCEHGGANSLPRAAAPRVSDRFRGLTRRSRGSSSCSRKHRWSPPGRSSGCWRCHPPAARTALEELADARIVTRKNVERATTGYFAPDVFDLLTIAERRLASTRWDTRQSAPLRPVPALPRRPARGDTECDADSSPPEPPWRPERSP